MALAGLVAACAGRSRPKVVRVPQVPPGPSPGRPYHCPRLWYPSTSRGSPRTRRPAVEPASSAGCVCWSCRTAVAVWRHWKHSCCSSRSPCPQGVVDLECRGITRWRTDSVWNVGCGNMYETRTGLLMLVCRLLGSELKVFCAPGV